MPTSTRRVNWSSRQRAGRPCRFAFATPVERPGTLRRRSRSSSRITGCSPTRTRSSCWEGLRTAFPVRVFPGATIAVDAHVEAPPEPGQYRLMWDVEQRHRLWFSTEPDVPLQVTRVAVSGPPAGPASKPFRMPLPENTVRPGRFVLWRAAAGLLADRPLLGVGPDNYPLAVRRRTPASPTFDRRVHTNNMYIEMLVGGGLVGGAAFAWLCWAAARQLAKAVRRRAGRAARFGGRGRSPRRRWPSGCTASSIRS